MSEEAINRRPHDPNKGLNVRSFSWAVVLALLILLAGDLLFVVHKRGTITPHAVTPKATGAVSPQ